MHEVGECGTVFYRGNLKVIPQLLDRIDCTFAQTRAPIVSTLTGLKHAAVNVSEYANGESTSSPIGILEYLLLRRTLMGGEGTLHARVFQSRARDRRTGYPRVIRALPSSRISVEGRCPCRRCVSHRVGLCSLRDVEPEVSRGWHLCLS